MQICLCSSMKQEGKKPSSLVSTNCFKSQHQDTWWSFFPEVKRSFFPLITGWGGTTVASGQGLMCGTPVGKESFCLGSSIWEGAVPTLIQDTGFLNNSTAFLFWRSHKLYSLLPQGLNFLWVKIQRNTDCTWVLDSAIIELQERDRMEEYKTWAHLLSQKHQNHQLSVEQL